MGLSALHFSFSMQDERYRLRELNTARSGVGALRRARQ